VIVTVEAGWQTRPEEGALNGHSQSGVQGHDGKRPAGEFFGDTPRPGDALRLC